MLFMMSTDEKKSDDGVPSFAITETHPSTVTETHSSRKKYVIVAVCNVVAVALVLAAILVGVYIFTEAEKDIVTEMMKINDFQVERRIDVLENVVQYHVKNPVYEQWAVEDLNSFLEVVKMKTNEGTIHCFVYPLNGTTTTNMKTVSQPMNEGSTQVQETYFLVSNTSIPSTAFLSKTANDMCDGIPIYWITPACPGTLEDAVRVKRRCRWGCWLIAAVAVVAVIVYPPLTPILKPVAEYVVASALDTNHTDIFK